MDGDYEIRLFELLEDAASWPATELKARAEAACADGPVRPADLLAALGGRNELADFLSEPVWAGDTGLPHIAGAPSIGDGKGRKPGARIGRYRLSKALGRGGMGQVFLAEQQDPSRRVALKLIRSDAISRAALQRFKGEQQALARLNHPNVAQFHDADLTDLGEPYFVMEWVDGRPVDKVFDDRPPDLEERLRVFLDICSAVRHAHQKQVVHRDLKPNNILVQDLDGELVVKVIDFGIAEALDQPLTDVRRSSSGGVYGTPEYLSPEAFDGDVDTRSDVYSLGVLLYELLSGTRPFRRDTDSVAALMERIRSGQAEAVSRAAESSGHFPRRWAGRLRGDLDAVVAKAMHPDRDRRYPAVADLMADIRRFLTSNPVSARPASLLHQARLLIRRRRSLTAAATVAALAICLGIVGTTFGLLKAQREAEATRAALIESKQLATFLTDLFRESDPGRARGAEITARELLDQGLERLQSGVLADQPLVKARLSLTIGDIYAKLGHFEEAESLLPAAAAIFHRELGSVHRESAQALHSLGVMKTKAGSADQARSYFEQALDIQEQISVPPVELALTVYHLGVLDFRARAWDAAEAHFERACAIWREAGEDEHRARCLEAFGALRLEQKRPGEAEALYRDSLELREKSLGPDHPHVAASLESLCILSTDSLRFDEAEAFCERALTIHRTVYGSRHKLVAQTLNRLAAIHRLQKRFDKAEGDFLEALSITRAQPVVDTRKEASLEVRLGWVLWLQGRYGAAEERYRRAYGLLGGSLDSNTSTVGNALIGLGLSAWKMKRFNTAEERLAQARSYFLSRSGPRSSAAAWTAWGLAGVYRDRADTSLHDLKRAGELYDEALEIRRQIYPAGHEYLVLTEKDFAIYESMMRDQIDRSENIHE